MKKIRRLSLVLFIFSVLAFSYPVTQVFAQGGGQCDSNPACNPNDPNAIPCFSLEGNSGFPKPKVDRSLQGIPVRLMTLVLDWSSK